MARCVWALADEVVTEHMCSDKEGETQKWLAVIIDTLHHDDQKKVFMTLRVVWHAWWKALHEKIYQSPLSVHHFGC
jgi:hypothetical protein